MPGGLRAVVHEGGPSPFLPPFTLRLTCEAQMANLSLTSPLQALISAKDSGN